MVSGGRVEVVIRKAPWAFQDPFASAVAWVPAVSELASEVFEGLTADGMEFLLGPSACHGTSCGLSGEREGGGAGLAGWECFPFPVSLHPPELSAGNTSSGSRSRVQRPVRRSLADAPLGRRTLVGVVNLRFAVSPIFLQEPAVHPRRS